MDHKNLSVRFFLSDNFHEILSEKMRKYRKIAPENDPCDYKFGIAYLRPV